MTVSTIISIIAAILSITKAFVTYINQQKWIDEGSAAAVLKGLQDANEAISRAQAARQLVRADIARDPSKLREHDPFERAGE